MTHEEQKQRFKELMQQNPPQAEIEKLFKKAVESGALDLANEPPEDYRLAKIIYHCILSTMAQHWQPQTTENKQEAENLKLFL
ncbi:hypothetical protein [Rhizosphaericola mali]|uniref:Uncharacterized protein n=1 Tax=Rhizosphaericola mali TaxID=2545455 RepID=A0A5P2G6T4_9BACT|nr:hypothetical protein [Rhizosphaericola mali]QES88943.1 hypothetical protein E0W69_009830 [Rhizosphaericola mali]